MAATAIGAGALAATAAAPLSLAAVAGGAAAGLVVNITASRLDGLWTRFKNYRLSRLDAGKKLDANHDEARAVREAQLEALRELLERYRVTSRAFSDDFREDKEFAQRAVKWVLGEIGCCLTLEVRHDEVVEAAVRETICGAFAARSVNQDPADGTEAQRALQDAAEQAVIDELVAATQLPPPTDFMREFRDSETGWFAGFTVQISAKIKQRPEVAAIWTAMRVAWIGEQTQQIQQELNALHARAAKLEDILFGTAPVQLHLPMLKAVAPQDRFSFKNPEIPFLGRAKELSELENFLDGPEDFSWHMLTGGGGAGKSRLALELCLRRHGSWRVGFARDEQSGGGFHAAFNGDWVPRKPHLIVVDYVLANAKMVQALLSTFSTRPAPFAHKVRVLLIEREDNPIVQSQTWGASNARQEIRTTRWRPTPLHVEAQSSTDLWSLCEPLLNGAPVKRGKFLEHHRKLDAERRTLTALMLAEAYGRGSSSLATLSELLDELLVHERRIWGVEIRHDVEELVLAMATMTNGYAPQRDAQHIPREIIDRLRHSAGLDRLRQVAPPQQDSETTIGRYLPDLIGEYFVLDALRRNSPPDPITGASRKRWLIEAAWRANDRAMSEFVLRASRDFKDLSDEIGLREPVEGVSQSYLLQAMLSAGSVVSHLNDWARAAIEKLRLPTRDRAALEARAFFVFLLTAEVSDLIDTSLIADELRAFDVAINNDNDPSILTDWAKASVNYIYRATAQTPQEAYALLGRLRKRQEDSGSSSLHAFWARAAAGFVLQCPKTEAPLASEVFQQLDRSAQDGSASEELLEYWGVGAAAFFRDEDVEPHRRLDLLAQMYSRSTRPSSGLLNQWASCAVKHIALSVEAEPTGCRALLLDLETCAHAEGATETIQERWLDALAAFVGMNGSLEPGEARRMINRVEERMEQSIATESLFAQCFIAIAAYVASLGAESDPTETRALLDRLTQHAIRRGSQNEPNVSTPWALAASICIEHLAPVDRDGARLLLDRLEQLSCTKSAAPKVSMAWGEAIALYIGRGPGVEKLEALSLIDRLEKQIPAGSEPSEVSASWARCVGIAVLQLAASHTSDARALLKRLYRRTRSEGMSPRLLHLWALAAAGYLKKAGELDLKEVRALVGRLHDHALRPNADAELIELWADSVSVYVDRADASHAAQAYDWINQLAVYVNTAGATAKTQSSWSDAVASYVQHRASITESQALIVHLGRMILPGETFPRDYVVNWADCILHHIQNIAGNQVCESRNFLDSLDHRLRTEGQPDDLLLPWAAATGIYLIRSAQEGMSPPDSLDLLDRLDECASVRSEPCYTVFWAGAAAVLLKRVATIDAKRAELIVARLRERASAPGAPKELADAVRLADERIAS